MIKLKGNESGQLELIIPEDRGYILDDEIHIPLSGGLSSWLVSQLSIHIILTEPTKGRPS